VRRLRDRFCPAFAWLAVSVDSEEASPRIHVHNVNTIAGHPSRFRSETGGLDRPKRRVTTPCSGHRKHQKCRHFSAGRHPAHSEEPG